MIDDSPSGMAYNRFINLDGIEDRIINYLLGDKYEEYEGLDKNGNLKTFKVVKQMKGAWNIEERPATPADIEAQKQVQIIRRLLKYSDSYALIRDDEDENGHPNVSFSDIVELIYNNNDKQNDFRVFRSPRLENSFNEECSLLKVYIDSIIPTNRGIGIVNVGVDTISNTRIINLIAPSSDEPNYYDYKTNKPNYSDKKKRQQLKSNNGDNEDEEKNNMDYIYEQRRKIGVPLAIAGHEENKPKYKCNHICSECSSVNKKQCAQNFLNRLIPVGYKSRVSVLTKAVLYLLNGADVAGVGRLFFSRENSIYNQAQYGIWNNRNFEGMKIVMGVSMSGVS